MLSSPIVRSLEVNLKNGKKNKNKITEQKAR